MGPEIFIMKLKTEKVQIFRSFTAAVRRELKYYVKEIKSTNETLVSCHTSESKQRLK